MKLIKVLMLLFLLLHLVEAKGQNFTQAWGHNFKNSLNSINKANSLLVDPDGYCYVLGTTWYTDSAKDIILLKYDSAGGVIWQRIYDNPSHSDDVPMNMCLDPEGNIWVCGMSRRSETNADFLIVKFTPDGVPISDELYDGKDHLFDCATYIRSDKKGNIYAGGYETTVDSGINLLLVKCRPDGSFDWKRNYVTKQMDVLNELWIDDSSNVYICGTINNGPHTADILVQKFDTEGKRKWQLVYDGLLSQNDAGQFISIDDSANIYVSGFINHTNSRADIPLIKISKGGQILQDIFYNGKIADCGAVNLIAGNKNTTIVGMCNDYNIAQLSYFVAQYEKSGKQKFKIDSPVDVQFMKYDESIVPLVLGTKITHPESTLIPYIARIDSGSIAWSFSDSTVYGLAHMVDVVVDKNAVYFLGDDTGDASGTINVFKYIFAGEVKPVVKQKTPAKKGK
jgi:hypothetical protein